MKITFIGAGSTIFAKNILGDCMLSDKLGDFEIALLDIDPERLEQSFVVISAIRDKYNPKVKINKYLYEKAKEAFRGANYVVNAIQVGGYDPCTITDFEVPKKYGLKQTIADTLGIGGIFRALRTIPVLKDYANMMEEVCPNALLLNYTNPMSILSGYMQRYTGIKTVGLCHSVQGCTLGLSKVMDMPEIAEASWKITGINHMAWLYELKDKDGNDLYPKIFEKLNSGFTPTYDLVRIEMMKRFGYYNTESSEHTAEYHPYFIKDKYPELIERFHIPIDEYIRRCINQIEGWKKQYEEMCNNGDIVHNRTHEFGSNIIEACETNIPFRIHGNVLNNGLITNICREACVEVPIMVDRNGLNPCFVGDLPPQLVALNNTHIGVHLMTIQAAVSRKKDDIYMAAYLDPHTRDQLSLDEIKSLCDDLIEAHGDWLPKFH